MERTVSLRYLLGHDLRDGPYFFRIIRQYKLFFQHLTQRQPHPLQIILTGGIHFRELLLAEFLHGAEYHAQHVADATEGRQRGIHIRANEYHLALADFPALARGNRTSWVPGSLRTDLRFYQTN